MNAFHAGRILATAAILWVTWHHAHWSVALPLTLMAINSELTAYGVRQLTAAINAILEIAK